MRTTLSLDDDVAILVERRQSSQKASLKTVVNEALRRGLADDQAPVATFTPFSTPTFALGPARYTNLDNVAEVLAVAEAEAFP